RDRVPLDGRIAAACLVAFLLSGHLGELGRTAVWTVTMPYLVLFAAYRGPRRLLVLTRPGDASYGMYLYGFIVQQAFLSGDPSIPPLVLFALAAPITYALGLVSWHLVESPALRLKRRLPLTPAALPVGVGAQAPAA